MLRIFGTSRHLIRVIYGYSEAFASLSTSICSRTVRIFGTVDNNHNLSYNRNLGRDEPLVGFRESRRQNKFSSLASLPGYFMFCKMRSEFYIHRDSPDEMKLYHRFGHVVIILVSLIVYSAAPVLESWVLMHNVQGYH